MVRLPDYNDSEMKWKSLYLSSNQVLLTISQKTGLNSINSIITSPSYVAVEPR